MLLFYIHTGALSEMYLHYIFTSYSPFSAQVKYHIFLRLFLSLSIDYQYFLWNNFSVPLYI